MKQKPSSQRGLTMISIAIILALIAFFTLLILKIGPIYLNHSKVVNALEALKETPDVENKSKREIETLLYRRFDINYVEHVDSRDIKITKLPSYLKIEVEYERVEPIFGNLSALAEFHEVIEVGNE
ncbi:DUF4845 domain-containing protein [Methylomarinum vadi]|uniref:DUF4845 domain-containing protein n=1 Tax=Methylomarinum vadi TaxID=438855 RepID=UPI0004DF31A9|nr:DUF4845 domain-containing protein [Methylomarinum vadi]